MHAPTDGGERAAGGAHAALVTRALHQGDSASRFNYLDLVTAKSGKLITNMNLTEHLSSLQLLCSYRPLPEFCVVLLLLQSKTFSICYNKSFNLM